MAFFSWLTVTGIIVLWIFSFSNNFAANILRKLFLSVFGVFNLVLTQDTRWKSPPDGELIKRCTAVSSKRIIVMRHGESAWNEVFNKGFGPKFLVRLVKAIMKEFALLPSKDSVFFDSPLNQEGVTQAKNVQEFLRVPDESAMASEAARDALQILRGEKDKSVIVCSNLRRCVETTVIGFSDRLLRTRENVFVLSSLQEISRNIDCVALTAEKESYELRGVIQSELKKPFKSFDVSDNYGNKPIWGLNGIDRMRGFCEWVFNRSETTIIAGGHSLYFRHFFKNYLPRSSMHEAGREKIHNCGIISFTLQRGILESGQVIYCVDPNSIAPVYLGFTKSKKKK